MRKNLFKKILLTKKTLKYLTVDIELDVIGKKKIEEFLLKRTTGRSQDGGLLNFFDPLMRSGSSLMRVSFDHD